MNHPQTFDILHLCVVYNVASKKKNFSGAKMAPETKSEASFIGYFAHLFALYTKALYMQRICQNLRRHG